MKDILNITKSLKVLYVEDDEQMRCSAIGFFNNFFDSIVSANDGADGLRTFEDGSFDLLITDIAMPYMDGIELITKIRAKNRTIPIIVFSAWNDPVYISACISLNIDGYLIKPMNSTNAIEVLQKVAEKISFSRKKKLQDKDMECKLQEKTDELKQMFNVDVLTGLKSHNALMEKLHAINNDETPVLILINIDEFHIYNELYGLLNGDKILKQFADILEGFVKDHPYELYRMSGDEFIFLDDSNLLDFERLENDIEALFSFIKSHVIHIEEVKEPITLNISVGISFGKENIYGRADMALHEARKRGRHYLGFSADADISKELQSNLYWREEINCALSENRVYAYYHDIVDVNEQVVKYEALVRIKQPQSDGTDKIIAPSDFLDFSKISKQYIGLTTVVIKEAFKTMIEHNVHVAINLSYQDIENPEINQLLRKNIKEHNLASKTKFDISSQVIFELLDNPNHDEYDKMLAFIDEFKALGVLVTVDNFGLGFSNFSSLAALAPNYIKIDAALIKSVVNDEHTSKLVSAIVKFSQELGIRTIAEHVSSYAIFQKCKELGIDEFQGYYFGEPRENLEEE